MKLKPHLLYFWLLCLLLVGFTILIPELLYFTLPLAFAIGSMVLKYRPTNYVLYAIVGLILLGVTVHFSPGVSRIWWVFTAILGVLSCIELAFLFWRVRFSVERVLPGRFALGRLGEVKIKIQNSSGTGYSVSVFDGVPTGSHCEQLPWKGFVPGQRFVELSYDVSVQERGWVTFGETYIEAYGPLRLWSRIYRVGEEEKVRVYPDYEPVLQLALMSMESNPEQMGIVQKNRAGLSKEFHQLRDYHQGDMLSQIDWKASSKRQSLISRDYHEQRDQNVILAIDCGRRMRAYDGEISQFDHCLNAMLLLAYVALRQGDNVGVMSYGGQDRWLPPVKGVNSMTVILNHLFDYETSSAPSDYAEAVERILVRQRRRAMIVFISNFRGEDVQDLSEPLKKLRQRHIVSLGNIREAEVDQAIKEDVYSFDDAVRAAAIQHYIDGRKEAMRQLKSMNIPSVDVTAAQLPVALANQYLALREMV